MAEQGRRILIIAGPNGAGKTTFAREYLLREANCPTFVNADLIAAGLSPFRPDSAAFQAGRLMLAEIARHAAAGISFGFETTLAGRGYARMIPRWQDDGYRVKLIFLQLDRPETAIARVAERVRQGGHDVPEETIRRRFHAGKSNFASLYRLLVDSWALYDNSGERPELKEWSSQHD
jgi:predicted ABC-type ATPase